MSRVLQVLNLWQGGGGGRERREEICRQQAPKTVSLLTRQLTWFSSFTIFLVRAWRGRGRVLLSCLYAGRSCWTWGKKTIEKIKICKHKGPKNNEFGRRDWGDGVTKLTYRILVEVRRHLTFLVTFLHLVWQLGSTSIALPCVTSWTAWQNKMQNRVR